MKVAPADLANRSPGPADAGRIDLPRPASLTNGAYSVQLRHGGTGVSTLHDRAVTRSSGDEVLDTDGIHFYLRDLANGSIWSAGFQPTCVVPDEYAFSCDDGCAEISRVDFGIACTMRVVVSPGRNVEVRSIQLTNQSATRRRIEIISYLEWVLGSADGDANHPAFSKLFVETEFCDRRSAIIARRRPRSKEDSEFFGFHAVRGHASAGDCSVEFETNRARFIGRGRNLRTPAALEPRSSLSQDTGAVLDPIASLRTVLSLAPHETRELSFFVGAGQSRADIDRMLESLDSIEEHNHSSQAASSNGSGHRLVSTHSAIHDTDADSDVYRPARVAADVPSSNEDTATQFHNGFGGFDVATREYVIRISRDESNNYRFPPMPWVNVIANERAGFIVSERGAGCTWSGNSRENRLTAWHNDPICDPHSEAIWLRDEKAQEFWSVTPGPSPSGNDYRVRHGLGYTVFEHTSHELAQELTTFLVRDEPLKIVRLRLTNLGDQLRELTLTSYAHWALNGLARDSSIDVQTTYDQRSRAVFATNPMRNVYGECVAFSGMCLEESQRDGSSFTCDRASFIGLNRELAAPAALATAGPLDEWTGREMDSCAAWQIPISVKPGETVECAFLLGEASDAESARALLERYKYPDSVNRAFEDARKFWSDTISAISIETPAPELDALINAWLPYQNLSCRMWARSAFYQPGGAFGFRDQLQDSAAMIFHRPDITRSQILRHAAHQFPEGDVLHWWHPDNEYGLRTRFSDDLLWLPLITAEYVERTGDAAILEEQTSFVEGPPLADGQQEAYLRPSPFGMASVYEHCCLALDRGLTVGPHGLPLIGCGDWNDGMNRVGIHQRGESVWLGFFIEHTLQKILPICVARGDTDRVSKYTAYRERLHDALNTAGWDGAWYRRAYYDDGQVIGSASSDECQIDALAQAWAVISGVASPERAESCLRSVEERLVDNEVGLIRLLTPAFNKTPNDPGYIRGYLPGIRENGGQYTHGVLWFVKAMAESGRGSRAVELLRMLSPIWHTRNEAEANRYQTEPYVVAADVYGEPPHVGRGGWTWYTGSAGWMFRVAVESIMGFSTSGGDTIVMNPSISSEWKSCKLKYRLPGEQTTFNITVENPNGKEAGVVSAQLDGQPVPIVQSAARIPLLHDDAAHEVIIHI
jgi:N,N'-diacetylchitobiose phosphorylase